jgi:hypothetical protein
MFILKLYDRKGNALKEGDIVKISNSREFTFYAEVKYIEEEGIIAPFHTFSFHSFEKVDSVPEGAVRSKEERYGLWYLPEQREQDVDAEMYWQYLSEWRQCEHLIDNRCWRIENITEPSYQNNK